MVTSSSTSFNDIRSLTSENIQKPCQNDNLPCDCLEIATKYVGDGLKQFIELCKTHNIGQGEHLLWWVGNGTLDLKGHLFKGKGHFKWSIMGWTTAKKTKIMTISLSISLRLPKGFVSHAVVTQLHYLVVLFMRACDSTTL